MVEFKCEIVERPAFAAAGLKISTGEATAYEDIVALWKKFSPLMDNFAGTSAVGLSYLLDPCAISFYYWAAKILNPGEAVPQGLESTQVPAGLYLRCPLEKIEDIGEAYDFIYNKWLPSQDEYVPNCAFPSCEWYEEDYLETGRFILYCPFLKK